MTATKTRLKKILEKTAGAELIKQIHFKSEKAIHFFKNRKYKKNNPKLAIPPDEWLFETFQLNYQKYFDDGTLAAKEIFNWTADFLQQEMPTILDWGCGTGRIIQQIHHNHPYALLYGADINAKMIAWNHQNIKDVYFSSISSITPTFYPSNYFDLVYGISVLTHLPSKMQTEWMKEMGRIIKPSGIFIVTTMGSFYTKQLLLAEKNHLDKNGIFENPFRKKNILQPGDRNYSVYVTAEYFENLIAPYFNIVQYFDGTSFPDKFGGQDLWILKKR